MNDYISRQAAVDIVVSECGKWTGLAKEISKQLKQLPSADVVPVVRCKDCKQFRRWVNTDIEFCDLTESTVFGDDFCSRGERRELAQ